ncbi:hypothetical protein [Piscinibacter sp. XHJ-5]|uniref:hypothetical protein n=1 Tax=Piscinibacter sp. XHJ-5 TaxID=3037797 RepID=UPI002453643F|nr:hypothetical protein [Piscinibacter sp. XHJ-5]
MATVNTQLKDAIEGLNRSVTRLQAAAGTPVPPSPPPRPGETDLSGGRVNPPPVASATVLPDGLVSSMAGLSEAFELLAKTGGPVNPPPVGDDGTAAKLQDAIKNVSRAVDELTLTLKAGVKDDR